LWQKFLFVTSDDESHGDMKTQLKNVQKRLVWGKEAMAKSRTLLDSIKTGIEHLKDKLNSISLVSASLWNPNTYRKS